MNVFEANDKSNSVVRRRVRRHSPAVDAHQSSRQLIKKVSASKVCTDTTVCSPSSASYVAMQPYPLASTLQDRRDWLPRNVRQIRYTRCTWCWQLRAVEKRLVVHYCTPRLVFAPVYPFTQIISLSCLCYSISSPILNCTIAVEYKI